MDFTPGGGMHTVGWNANHLADIAGWATSMILEHDELDLAPPGGEPMTTPEATDPAEIVKTFDANLAQSRAAIAAASDEKLAEPWTLKYGGHSLFTMPKGDVLRTWVVMHCVHHTAMLTSHLRLAGVELGSMFEEMPGTPTS